MRIRDWYFQGWERQVDANGQKQFHYTGEYYSFPGGTKALKGPCGAMTAALTVLYLIIAFLPSAGGMWRIAAIPQLITIVPLLYLIMGTICLLRAPERLTYRDYHTSWRRMKGASVCCVITTGAMVIVEIVFLCLGMSEVGTIGREILYLLGELGCLALSALLVWFIRKHPCSQSV